MLLACRSMSVTYLQMWQGLFAVNFLIPLSENTTLYQAYL